MTAAAAAPIAPVTCEAPLDPDAAVEPEDAFELVESVVDEDAVVDDESVVVVDESPASTAASALEEPTTVESTAALPAPTVAVTPAEEAAVVAEPVVVAAAPVAAVGIVLAADWPFTAATARAAMTRTWMNFMVEWSRLGLEHLKVEIGVRESVEVLAWTQSHQRELLLPSVHAGGLSVVASLAAIRRWQLVASADKQIFDSLDN